MRVLGQLDARGHREQALQAHCRVDLVGGVVCTIGARGCRERGEWMRRAGAPQAGAFAGVATAVAPPPPPPGSPLLDPTGAPSHMRLYPAMKLPPPTFFRTLTRPAGKGGGGGAGAWPRFPACIRTCPAWRQRSRLSGPLPTCMHACMHPGMASPCNHPRTAKVQDVVLGGQRSPVLGVHGDVHLAGHVNVSQIWHARRQRRVGPHQRCEGRRAGCVSPFRERVRRVACPGPAHVTNSGRDQRDEQLPGGRKKMHPLRKPPQPRRARGPRTHSTTAAMPAHRRSHQWRRCGTCTPPCS